MSETIRVFISSTWQDLQPERKAVENTLHCMQDTSFAGMEYFGSRPETPEEVSLAELDRSEVYVGIFAHRYGSGITEAEYRRARECEIPCLIYLKDEDAPVIPADIERDPAKAAKVEALKRELKQHHIVSFFRTPDQLASQVAADLHNLLDRGLRARDRNGSRSSPKYQVTVTDSQGIIIGDGAQVQFLQGEAQHIFKREYPPPPAPARPPECAGFVGRDAELAYFGKKLRETHLAVITGWAGIGKTSLAAMLARQVADSEMIFWHRFREGEGIEVVIWELAGFLTTHAQVELWHMLQGAQQGAGQPPPVEVLIEYSIQAVRGKGYLICFDDCQHIMDNPSLIQLVDRLRPHILAGEISSIITSRIAVPFLEVYEFDPLAGLTLEDTHQLVARRSLALADELVERLHGRTQGNAQLLTMAIDILQSRKDPARIIAQLAETTEVELYLMHELDRHLTDDERTAMKALAVLLGHPATRDAIEAVAGREALQGSLHSLFGRCLLSVSQGEAGREYIQHDIVQAFYYEMVGSRDRRPMHLRAGEYYETEERDLLRAALHLERAGSHERAARLATEDTWALCFQGRAPALRLLLDAFSPAQLDRELWIAAKIAQGDVQAFLKEIDRAKDSYQEAFSASDVLPFSPEIRKLRARACFGMGSLWEYEAPPDAQEWLRRGLDQIGREDTHEEALLRLKLGSVLFGLGDFAAAERELEQSLHLLPEAPSNWRASALGNLGSIRSIQGNVESGKAYFEQVLGIYQRFHNLWGEATARLNLGMAAEISGDWEGAVTEYRTAVELAEQLGEVTRQQQLDLALGVLYTNRGDDDLAVAHLERCIDLARVHHSQEQLVHALSSLADLRLRQGEVEMAEVLVREAEQMVEQIDTRYQLPEIYRRWAEIHLAKDEPRLAVESGMRSVDLAGEMEMAPEEALGRRVQGQALFACGEVGEAYEAFERSLAFLSEYDPYEAARTKMQWGRALVAGGKTKQAITLLGEAVVAFRELGACRDEAAAQGILPRVGPSPNR